MEFKKAVKTKSKLRLAIDGISGSGKTYTALAIASGMGSPIALIDSEHGSASLYGDIFDFDTVDLTEFQIENYIEALNTAAASKYPVVIIDSTSHAWDALVERVDRIAATLSGGNASFRAWAQGTPLQKKLIEAMLSYPGHVIVTCRSKTEYSIDKDDKGKTTISKVGTAAVQRQGFEYEFTMAMTMDANHIGHITKDRTSKFQDQFIEKPGKKFGQQLITWLNEGAIDYAGDIRAKKSELWNLLNSKNEAGRLIFTQEEIDKVVAQMQTLVEEPYEKQLREIEAALDIQKKELFKRLEAAAAKTEAPKKKTPPAVPAATAASTPKDPPAPDSDNSPFNEIRVIRQQIDQILSSVGKDGTPLFTVEEQSRVYNGLSRSVTQYSDPVERLKFFEEQLQEAQAEYDYRLAGSDAPLPEGIEDEPPAADGQELGL